jgi:hypothetical protein
MQAFCRNYCSHSDLWGLALIAYGCGHNQMRTCLSSRNLILKHFFSMISYFCLIVRCNPKAIHFRCTFQSNIIFTVYIHTTSQCNSIRPQGHKFRLNISHHSGFPFRKLNLVKTSTAITYVILFSL